MVKLSPAIFWIMTELLWYRNNPSRFIERTKLSDQLHDWELLKKSLEFTRVADNH